MRLGAPVGSSHIHHDSHLRTSVSRLTFPQQIEVHVFYLALGYFISYLLYDLLAKRSSGIVPGVDWPVGGLVLLAPALEVADRTHCLADSDIPEPAAASLEDHRYTAALIQQTVQKRLAEKFL